MTHVNIPNPCYVLEEARLRRNLELIARVAREADTEIILAFKAFALWKSFPLFRPYIGGAAASSVWEARLAAEEFGMPAHTFSPAYEPDTFPDMLRYSQCVVFNSLSQLCLLAGQLEDSRRARLAADQRPVSVGLRVNPEYSEIETLIYNPCAPGSRFGILSEDLPSQLPAGIEGFHIHCHCESEADAFERTLAHIESKFSGWFPQLKWINFGGGHLMTREGYDTALLIRTLQDFHRRYPWLHTILEPGSAFLWDTGNLYARVVDIVENHRIKTAILNVSFTCHMPDCLEMPYMPHVVGADVVEADCACDPTVYRLGGNSCLSGDWLGQWRFPRPLQLGDEVVFTDMIHYTTVKTSMFNGVAHPSIGLLHTDGTFELYRRFSYPDYRDRMC